MAENQRWILLLILDAPKMSKAEMARRLGISTTAIDKNIETLKEKGLLKRVGPVRGGHWEVVG